MYALCGIRKFHIETTNISELKKIPEETKQYTRYYMSTTGIGVRVTDLIAKREYGR
jgi:hypothetical protein